MAVIIIACLVPTAKTTTGLVIKRQVFIALIALLLGYD